MTFWGVKVNPGKPFSHSCCDTRHRLHLSQATLDLGPETKKVSVQCNVGKRSPVLLCSLLPEKWESCPLSLEFQEPDDVTFSVIGPRSVYLTGYYVDVDTRSQNNENSESYGEDIVDTDCEKSVRSSDEDAYEDSFINDGDPDVLSSSSLSTGKGDHKHNIRKGKFRRLRKCKLNISRDDDSSHNEICNNSGKTVSGTVSDLDPEVEQNIEEIANLPACNNMEVGQTVGSDDKTGKTGEVNRHEVDELVEDEKPQEDLVAAEVVSKSGKRKKRKDRVDDKLQRYADKVGEQVTSEVDNTTLGKTSPGHGSMSHASVMQCDNHERPRKRNKYSHDNGDIDFLGVNKTLKDDAKAVKSKYMHEEHNNSRSIHVGGIHHEKSKKRKMKRESKVALSAQEKNGTLKETAEKPFQIDTIKSTGLIIEEIEMGDANGKIASLGKKVRIHYVCRLKGDKKIINSSIEQAPFKFRLGGETVIEGWNVGLEGMRVGGKRKLIIPPSMAYGREGDGNKIPPNSWLEYDVELVRVH